jgi:hypothetical protein
MERKLWTEPFDQRVLAEGLALARGDLLRIKGGRAVLFVEHGPVWITQEEDGRDVVLPAGAWLRLEGDGITIVQAAGDASVTLTAAADALAPEVQTVPRTQRDPGARPRFRRFLRALQAGWLRLHRYGARSRRQRFVPDL